ncbi:MAG: outer membrane beta-barrel protein [Candidatus Eisenbacteria bacterium]
MRSALRAVLLLLLTLLPAEAAIADSMPPGTHELGGSAEIVLPEGGSYVRLSPRLGTVFAPGCEVEFEMGFARESNGLSNSTLSFAADFLYNFETMSAPYPFMLAGLGFARSHREWEQGHVQYESSDTNGLLNLGAGIRVPLTESGLIRVELRYTHEFSSPEANTTVLRAGLSFLLK